MFFVSDFSVPLATCLLARDGDVSLNISLKTLNRIISSVKMFTLN